MTQHPFRRFLVIFLGFNALLALVVWGTLGWYTSHGDAISVPALRGLSLEDAQRELEDRGLRFMVVDSVYAEGLDPSAVVLSDPDSGFQVKSGRTVYLTLNLSDLPSMPVPDLTDLSLRKATMDLTNKGFVVGQLIMKPDLAHQVVLGGQHKGREVRTGQMLPKGSVIDLLVGFNNSDSLVEVPNLTGLTLDEARIFLAESSLSLGSVHYLGTVGDSSQALIVRQRPMAGGNGSQVRALDFVDLWLAD
ncbi:MAG: PASTA domain-containing protein [Cytophagia bacterium]|nr:PASTA domain-containing protein [Cytophagia bacterium]